MKNVQDNLNNSQISNMMNEQNMQVTQTGATDEQGNFYRTTSTSVGQYLGNLYNPQQKKQKNIINNNNNKHKQQSDAQRGKYYLDQLAKVHELQDQKHSLGQEINLLRSMVQKLMQENAGLRAQIAQVMVERDDLEQRLNMVQYDRPTNNNMSLEALSLQLSSQSFSMVGDSNYDNVSYKNPSPPVMSSHDLNVDSSEDSTAYRTEDDIEIPSGPSQSQIVMATEQITKKIQELLQAAQGGQNSKYVECSSNISAAVTDMANLFPESPPSENVRMALRLMITSAARLQVECKSRSLDQAMLTQQVIQCSYDIAKAAKQLVTTYNESQAQAAAAAQGQSHAVSGN